MKLKQIILTLSFVIVAALGSKAQGTTYTYDTENCKKYISLYYQYLKQDMYRDAMNFWQMAYGYCGGEDSSEVRFFSNARIGYLKLMDAEKADTVRRAELRDSVYWLHEVLIRKDKDKSADWSGRYGSMLVTENDKRFDKIDSLFKNSVHVLKADSPPAYIHQYFKHLIVNRFNAAPADKKDAMRDFIIDEYLILSDYVAEGAAKKRAAGNEDEAKKYDAEQDFMDKYFLQIVKDTETLTNVMEKRIVTLPADKDAKAAKVKSYIELMDKKNAQGTATYGKLMDTLISLDPTAEAYYLTGNYYLGQNKDDKAVEYFEKAVEMEGTGAKKDDYTYALAAAQYKAGRYKAAYSTAKRVEGTYRGKALMICGNAIAATANSCGETTFDRKANFWLANDYYKKAAALGEEGASTSKFLSSAPTEAEVFEANKTNGSQHFCTCWGESTVIR